MNWKLCVTAAAITVAAGLSGQSAWSQTSGVKTGVLSCNVARGWGLVFGSSRELNCTYADTNNKVEHYAGHIGKFGVDLGYHAGGIGAGANVLVGGATNTISLQPLSIEGTTGLNVAAGIAQMVLKTAK